MYLWHITWKIMLILQKRVYKIDGGCGKLVQNNKQNIV